jgi:PAS domain S-box-containing protein
VLADDNPDMREYLTGLLDRAGYQIQTVSEGEAAFAACVVAPSALLLSDVMMPNLDGLELTRRLRADPRTAAIPVLLLSARAGETARIEGFLAGADEYIEKPFGARELIARVAAAVRLAKARTESAQQERQIAVLARLSSVVASAMDAIISVNAQQRVVLFNAAAEQMFGWSAQDAMGRPLNDFIPERFRAEHEGHVRAFGEHGVTDRAMGRLGDLSALRADGGEFPIEASISQAVFEGEKLFTVILRDISARKAAAETQRVLIGELDHRVKNTLATVQAIARQTLDISIEPGASFNGRLHAMASAHTLLTRSNWHGADLNTLIRDQLTFGLTSPDERIVCAGPEVVLSPQGALHLGLVLHELGTNARKHGSLSDPRGRLDLNWEVTEGEASRWLERVRLFPIQAGFPNGRNNAILFS